MLISICEDNYAIYDEKENKIKFGYGDKGAVGSMLVPEGKKVTDLCITETYLSFILDRTQLVRGKLNQNIDKPEFRSVDTIPPGRTWRQILYISKKYVKKFILVAAKEDGSDDFEIFYELGTDDWSSGTFMDVTPNEHNTIDKLPESDSEMVHICTNHYVGFYDATKKTFLWQKVDLLCAKLYALAAGAKSIYYTGTVGIVEGSGHVPEMGLHRADVKKLINRDSDAIQTIFEKCFITTIHTFNDAVIIQTFSPHIIIYKGEGHSGHVYSYLKLDEDDFLMYMKGFKNNVLYQTKKGRVFHLKFLEDLSDLESMREVT
jgi:hypothetical protein